jgi:hypothetical protein
MDSKQYKSTNLYTFNFIRFFHPSAIATQRRFQLKIMCHTLCVLPRKIYIKVMCEAGAKKRREKYHFSAVSSRSLLKRGENLEKLERTKIMWKFYSVSSGKLRLEFDFGL